MRRLGHIGSDPIFYNWCAAFVAWCAREAGWTIPDQPTGWNATMALVDSWKFWANQQGYFLTPPPVGQMQAGDVLLYEWSDGDRSLDHIGVFVRAAGRNNVVAAEGNVNNRGAITERNVTTIVGLVRLPD